jgi:hypothetical protein
LHGNWNSDEPDWGKAPGGTSSTLVRRFRGSEVGRETQDDVEARLGMEDIFKQSLTKQARTSSEKEAGGSTGWEMARCKGGAAWKHQECGQALPLLLLPE